MKYIVSYEKPNNHYIDIEYIIDNVNTDTLQIQLPAWRPGRYELANFAKNVQQWEAYDENGNVLLSKKVTKDLWEVTTNGVQQVHVKYNYFANEINAGSSYLDSKQLYINGVNCFLYVPERINEECQLELNIPTHYQVASGLKEVGKHKFQCASFHELVDCPFIASDLLQHHDFEESGVKFHLWFQGECKPDWKKLEADFSKFIHAQIEAFGDFPVKEYHFLFQILTYETYHGVEHSNSTVITLGPSYSVMLEKGRYHDLLGVSSHELYHTWNVKQIRPIEMYPYDYTQENYTVLGYLDEGVTTYMGDKFLFIAAVFDWKQYVKEFNVLLEKHYNNFGVNNYSVAQSSFDTWLDGYVLGAPGRKGSIYTEGALVAFMTDVFILQSTNNQRSLNDVMKLLYNDYAKRGIGVSDQDYKGAVEQIAGQPYNEIYNDYLHGKKDYTEKLKESLAYIGCELQIQPSKKHHEAALGFKVDYTNQTCIVSSIFTDSVAEKSGLSINDEVIAVNGIKVNNDLTAWVTYFKGEEITLSVKRELGTIERVMLQSNDAVYFKKYTIVRTVDESENFESWCK